ncbi:hypothetical protein [Haloarcula montana]|nr:hypothetical protein [Haloarcula sp. GH36]
MGLGGGEVTLVMDLGLRAVGMVLFALLLFKNRQRGRIPTEQSGAAEPT